MSDFNYSSFVIVYMVWIFTSKKTLDRIQNVHNAPCVFVLNDYHSSYLDLLIQSEVSGIQIMILRLLEIDVYKYENKSNPEYLNETSTTKNYRFDFRDNSILERPRSNTTKYGLNIFRNYGVSYGIFKKTIVTQLYQWVVLKIYSNTGIDRVVSSRFALPFLFPNLILDYFTTRIILFYLCVCVLFQILQA